MNSPAPPLSSPSCVLSQVSLPFDLVVCCINPDLVCMCARVCLNYSHGSCIKADGVETGVTLLFSRDREALSALTSSGCVINL